MRPWALNTFSTFSTLSTPSTPSTFSNVNVGLLDSHRENSSFLALKKTGYTGTDKRTDTPSYRDVRTHLKNIDFIGTRHALLLVTEFKGQAVALSGANLPM